MGEPSMHSTDRLTPTEWATLEAHRRRAGLAGTLLLLIAFGVFGGIAAAMGVEGPRADLLAAFILVALSAAGLVWLHFWRRLPTVFRERVRCVRRAHPAWWWSPYALIWVGGPVVVGLGFSLGAPTWLAVLGFGVLALGSRLLVSASERRLVAARD